MNFNIVGLSDIYNCSFYKKCIFSGYKDCLYFIKKNLTDIIYVYNNIDKFTSKRISEYDKYNNGFILLEKLKIDLQSNNVFTYLELTPPVQTSKNVFKDLGLNFNGNSYHIEILIYDICMITLTYYYLQKSVNDDYKKKMTKEDLDSYIVKNSEEDKIWYRGQSDFSWELIPSFLRDIKEEVKIDGIYLYDDYIEKKLVEKYNKVFNEELKSINYEFLSFMQHSVSYSPLLDFSDSPLVAISFALSNNNQFNNYYRNHSSMFELECRQETDVNKISQLKYDIKSTAKLFYADSLEKIDLIMKNIDIRYCNSYVISDYFKVIPTIFEVLNSLTPNVVMIDIPTNDRMKYQQGKFILFDNFVCINNNIFYELNRNFAIRKIKIENRSKDKIREEIRKNHQPYTITNLLDPYNYFNE